MSNSERHTNKKVPMVLGPYGLIEAYQCAADENYMSEGQRQYFRNILSKWREIIIDEARQIATTVRAENHTFPDVTDRATREEEQIADLKNLYRENRLIKKIDLSLEWIEKEQYGFCQSCRKPIGLDRLQARPTATLCITCKEIAEMEEKNKLG